jgi:hypothetical protein
MDMTDRFVTLATSNAVSTIKESNTLQVLDQIPFFRVDEL